MSTNNYYDKSTIHNINHLPTTYIGGCGTRCRWQILDNLVTNLVTRYRTLLISFRDVSVENVAVSEAFRELMLVAAQVYTYKFR